MRPRFLLAARFSGSNKYTQSAPKGYAISHTGGRGNTATEAIILSVAPLA